MKLVMFSNDKTIPMFKNGVNTTIISSMSGGKSDQAPPFECSFCMYLYVINAGKMYNITNNIKN